MSIKTETSVLGSRLLQVYTPMPPFGRFQLGFPSASSSAATKGPVLACLSRVFLNLNRDVLSLYADVVSRHALWRGRTQLLAGCDIKSRSMPRAGDLFAVEIAL
jgi:hypothetical protein